MSVSASAVTLFVTGLSTGLVAGGASCAAVQGGLLAGAVSRRTAPAPARTGKWATQGRGAAHPHQAAKGTATGSGAAAATQVETPRGAAVWSVAAFLAAKLVSHTLLGAALGAAGAAIQPGPRARAMLLVLAGAAMVVFALDLLGVRVVRNLVPRPPQAFTTRVRRSARSGATVAPAVLGFLTVLIPCGVTLSVELLAVTSGSPLVGAAVMAGFVLGTTPLFAALGFLLRQSTRVLQGRLTMVTAVVVLGVAVWTLGSGLRLGGWLPSLQLGGGSGGQPVAAGTALSSEPGGGQVITLTVDDSSYTPQVVQAKAGTKTTLVLHTEGTRGCTRAFVIPDRGVEKILPETGETRIDLGVPQPGTMDYGCAMGMYGGRITFTGGEAAR